MKQQVRDRQLRAMRSINRELVEPKRLLVTGGQKQGFSISLTTTAPNQSLRRRHPAGVSGHQEDGG